MKTDAERVVRIKMIKPRQTFFRSVGVGFIPCSINWNLSDKYNQNNCCNQKNNSNYKFYYSYSSRIAPIFPSGLKIFLETIDERIFIFEEDEVTEQGKSKS